MKRTNEKLAPGPGLWASHAARIRTTSGDYRVAAAVEDIAGERRTWGPNGETLHAIFAPTGDEFSRRGDYCATGAYYSDLGAPWKRGI